MTVEHPENVDTDLMTIEQMKTKGVMNLDSVYTVGYPALKDSDLSYPTPSAYATSSLGRIANIESLSEGRDTSFVIDISVAPGSSGSPVIRERYISYDVLSGKPIAWGSIIGIISKGIYYRGENQEEGVINGWTSRLTRVFPVDYILETEKCNEKGLFATMERRA